jgi:hypothetical protein
MVGISCNPKPVQEDGEFASHRNNGTLLCVFAAALGHSRSPPLEVGIGPEASHQVLCALNEEGSETPVASFADSQLLVCVAGLATTWRQSEIRTHISGMFETTGITDGQDKMECGHCSHTTDLAKPCSFGVLLAGEILNCFIEAVDLLVQMGNRF